MCGNIFVNNYSILKVAHTALSYLLLFIEIL